MKHHGNILRLGVARAFCLPCRSVPIARLQVKIAGTPL